MLDTKKQEQEQLAALLTAMGDLDKTHRLVRGALSMIILCGFSLTVSTILWQWLG